MCTTCRQTSSSKMCINRVYMNNINRFKLKPVSYIHDLKKKRWIKNQQGKNSHVAYAYSCVTKSWV